MTKWWSVVAVLGALAAGSCGGGYTPACGNGILDPGEECDDGNRWNNDGCSSQCTLEIAHTGLTANVGINRGVVPGYDGDACGTVAKYLVIDGTGPDGALDHQDLNCAKYGQFGWSYTDIAAGHYTVTMQLFTDDASGNRVALTDPRSAEGDVPAGGSTTIWVDFDFRDFSQSYTGNLKWQYSWGSGEAGDGGVADAGMPDAGTPNGVACAQAAPAVSQVRLTLRNEQGQVVNDQTSLSSPTNGSARVACHDFGTSDAEVVSGLPWGIYELTLEGYNSSTQVVFCARRQLFNTKGDGVIFHLTGEPGTCQ